VKEVVMSIVAQFKTVTERKGLWKLFWHAGRPHHERVAQMVFFALADAYCKANNLDITPEAETGVGPVDFKMSAGYHERILVEVKLSTNPRLVAGYEKQLKAYDDAESPISSTYLVIDVGGLGRKDQQLLDARNDRIGRGVPAPEVILVDGTPQRSASKRV
jgi:hypothetical protein